MGYILDSVRRFFHPGAVDEMLEAFLPSFNGTNLNVRKLTFVVFLAYTKNFHSQF